MEAPLVRVGHPFQACTNSFLEKDMRITAMKPALAMAKDPA
jgi:hypothetical protein